MRTANQYYHSFLARSMGVVVRVGLTDGFNTKAQLTEVVKVCEQSTSAELEVGICLQLLLISLNLILCSTLVHLYRTKAVVQ